MGIAGGGGGAGSNGDFENPGGDGGAGGSLTCAGPPATAGGGHGGGTGMGDAGQGGSRITAGTGGTGGRGTDSSGKPGGNGIGGMGAAAPTENSNACNSTVDPAGFQNLSAADGVRVGSGTGGKGAALGCAGSGGGGGGGWSPGGSILANAGVAGGGGGGSYVASCSAPDRLQPIVAAAASANGLIAIRPSSQELSIVPQSKGGGGGSVAVEPLGKACFPSCFFTLPFGNDVTLTAHPNSGSKFVSWFGGGCSGSAGWSVPMTGPTEVTAVFATSVAVVTIGMQGAAPGDEVFVSPSGQQCAGPCEVRVAVGGAITLTAKPGTGRVFVGWQGGGCAGVGPCTLRPNANTTIFAA